MKTNHRFSPGLSFLLLSLLPGPATADEFLAHSLWDKGQAEMTVYTAREIRYGTARDSEALHILVKEPWNTGLGVKSDTRADTEVLKLNQILSVPTGSYRYESMHSLFTERKSGKLLKFSLTLQDGCGNTFKMGRFTDRAMDFTWNSYWDGEGDGKRRIDWPDNAHLYEELPLLARRWAAGKPAFPLGLRLLNPQTHSRLGSPGTAAARAEVILKEGQFHFTIQHPGGKDRLVVDEHFPHTLRQWTRADGSSLVIRKTLMLDYWNKNRPGDETLLR